MGLSAIRGTKLYEFASLCAPREAEITERHVFSEYTLQVAPQYLNILGTMCDYGVRARNSHRDFGYVQFGLIKGRYKDLTDKVERLVREDFLSVDEAYLLATGKNPAHLSQAFYDDYIMVTERAIALYRMLHLKSPHYGRYYVARKPIDAIECDCVSDTAVVDMKIARTFAYRADYWTQVMLYSFLSRARDSMLRTELSLLYPAQGIVLTFNYPVDSYNALYRRFIKIYEEECYELR